LKILITGATGYIGGKLARYLAGGDLDIVCLVRKGKSVDGLPVREGDILKPDILDSALRDIDIVIHCAGALGKWDLPKDYIYRVNVEGVGNIVHAAYKAGVKYFVHLSTSGVTGPLGSTPANETIPCRPYTLYECTKYEGELLALSIARETGLPLSVIRPTFVYGPGDPHKLPLFKAVKKRIMVYVGNPESTIHPVYIDDLLDGIGLVLEKRPVHQVFFLGGEHPISKRKLLQTMAYSMGVNPPFLAVPSWIAWHCASVMEFGGKTFSKEPILNRSRVLMMSRNWGVDISKAKKELGYLPKFNLDEGIARTVGYYREKGLL
jgi:nucleoside-diphosphate-sugar epimerase